MAYKSIDELQSILSVDVFGDRQDSKKAAGRALGTFIETIVYYLLRQWGECDSVAIERPLIEYGRAEITHNVEFTFHPVLWTSDKVLFEPKISLTGKKILSKIRIPFEIEVLSNKLIDKDAIKNGCVIGKNKDIIALAVLDKIDDAEGVTLHISVLSQHAYAMIECKRVGKEGDAKGPQTIEKAKQGAYVAKVTSSLQKVRNDRGEMEGVYYIDGKAQVGPYDQMLNQIIASNNPKQIADFTLSIGVVSNHGNWFSESNQNKEMKVLAQSYDWLLFLTDEGLAQFITDLLTAPIKPEYECIKDAFAESYSTKRNVFTKKSMDLSAHKALSEYFASNQGKIESWFNVISPKGGKLKELRNVLATLKEKEWRKIL